MQRVWVAVAILAGLCWAASFPNMSLAGLAWVAPALMLTAAAGKRGWETFRIGYVAGLTHYLASLYWLLLIPYRWHSIPLGPAAERSHRAAPCPARGRRGSTRSYRIESHPGRHSLSGR